MGYDPGEIKDNRYNRRAAIGNGEDFEAVDASLVGKVEGDGNTRRTAIGNGEDLEAVNASVFGKVGGGTEEDDNTEQDHTGDDQNGREGSDDRSSAIRAGEDFNTRDTTVVGQLEKIMGKDSAIARNQRINARNEAAASGLMSTSIAIGESQRRQFEALTKVASQDAKTAKELKLAEQQAYNDASTVITEGNVSKDILLLKEEISERETKIDQDWEMVMKNLNHEQQKEIEILKGRWGKRFINLEGEIKKELQDSQVAAGVQEQLITGMQQDMQNYQITVQGLMSDEDFMLQFTPEEGATEYEKEVARENMRDFFDSMFKTVSSSIVARAKFAGLYDPPRKKGLKSYINELIADNKWGKYKGAVPKNFDKSKRKSKKNDKSKRKSKRKKKKTTRKQKKAGAGVGARSVII